MMQRAVKDNKYKVKGPDVIRLLVKIVLVLEWTLVPDESLKD